MKKLFFTFLLVSVSFIFIAGCTISRFAVLTMPNNQTIKVKLARTKEEMRVGLSGIEAMNDYDGMWFSYAIPSQARFWMKGMRFPLDIIYLNEQKKILEIFDNQPPCSEGVVCPAVTSSGDAVKYILEVPAGAALKLGLAVGEQIKE